MLKLLRRADSLLAYMTLPCYNIVMGESMSLMALCSHTSCYLALVSIRLDGSYSCGRLKNGVDFGPALLFNALLIEIHVVLFVIYSVEERLNFFCM